MQADSEPFLLLFQQHPEPMWIYDLQTLRFLEVNAAAIEQYGYSRDEFLAMDIRQIRPPEEADRLAAELAQPRSQLHHPGIWRHQCRDGSVLEVEITSHTLTYAGRPAALVIAHDVAARLEAQRHSEQFLREAEAARRELQLETRKFELLFEQLADPVMLFDADGAIVRMNQAARAIFEAGMPTHAGSVSSPVLARRFNMRDEHGVPVPPEDLPIRRVLRGELLTGASAFEAQVGPRSRPIYLSISGSALRDEHGQIIGAVMISRDVTERRRAEQQAQAGLRQLNERMQAFLSMAAHEMRTPLTTIFGNIQLARRSLNEVDGSAAALRARLEQLKPLVNRMEQQTRRLNGLVDDVLNASAMEASQLELCRERFDLVRLVYDVLDDARGHMPGRPIHVEAPAQASVEIEADRERIGQVISHLLSNAHKFSPPLEPIAIGIVREPATVKLCVADHGPGVPPAEQQRIWERFYRVEGRSHVTGSSVGLGLGLYLSRLIVERHGGSVGLDQPDGDGSRFWVRLPLAPAAVASCP